MLDALGVRLNRIEQLLHIIATKETLMTADLDHLETSVKADTDATSAVLTLIQGIVIQLASMKNNPVRLQGLIDQLNANAGALSKAVFENTPATTPATAAAPETHTAEPAPAAPHAATEPPATEPDTHHS